MTHRSECGTVGFMSKPTMTYEELLREDAEVNLRRSKMVDRLMRNGVPWADAVRMAGLAHRYSKYLEEGEQ